MISKETFIQTMEKLDEMQKKADAVDAALKNYDSDFGGFGDCAYTDIIIKLLVDDLRDTGHIIEYAAYELNMLHSIHDREIVYGTRVVKLDSWADVYDLLTMAALTN